MFRYDRTSRAGSDRANVRHADFIGSKLEVMREDSRAIVRAASQASKAADWILSFLPDADSSAADADIDRRAA